MSEAFDTQTFLGEGRILPMRDWYQLKKDELRKVAEHLQVECAANIRKTDLIEKLSAKVSPDSSLPDKETMSVELQLAKLELEKERIKQRAAQESAMLELDRERIRREFEYRQKELEQEKAKLKLEERKVANMEPERGFDLSRNIRLVIRK